MEDVIGEGYSPKLWLLFIKLAQFLHDAADLSWRPRLQWPITLDRDVLWKVPIYSGSNRQNPFLVFPPLFGLQVVLGFHPDWRRESLPHTEDYERSSEVNSMSLGAPSECKGRAQ